MSLDIKTGIKKIVITVSISRLVLRQQNKKKGTLWSRFLLELLLIFAMGATLMIMNGFGINIHFPFKKSRIRETMNLLMCADNSILSKN